MLLVERHYLKTYGGGFTENFYALKRERVLRIKGGEVPRAQFGAPAIVRETLKLREVDIWKNLAVMVGLPYLKRKLDESYDIHAPQAAILGPSFARDSLPSNSTLKQRIMYYYKWFIRRIYPSVNAAYHFSILAFNLAYLFDSSKFSSPFLWLIGTRIRRLGEADHRAIAAATQPKAAPSQPTARPGQSTSLFNPRTFTQALSPHLSKSLNLLLPTSIFALKFLEWWHASDFARQLSRKATEGLDLPAPIISNAPRSPQTSHKPSSWLQQKISDTYNTSSSEKKPISALARSNPPPAPRKTPPLSATTSLPIFTVPLPPADHEHPGLCPICRNPIATATATPYGYVFCYACIHRWVEGEHERQIAFMEGAVDEEIVDDVEEKKEAAGNSREGRWESGVGRCAVSGKRILGGTEGLRRVVV